MKFISSLPGNQHHWDISSNGKSIIKVNKAGEQIQVMQSRFLLIWGGENFLAAIMFSS
jgi:hypothetical protein